jgi:hypothetical protein
MKNFNPAKAPGRFELPYYSPQSIPPSGVDGWDGEGSERPWLLSAGYEFDGCTWSKRIRSRAHTCRRDHQDGTIKTGDWYSVTVTRHITDETGESYHRTVKQLLRRQTADEEWRCTNCASTIHSCGRCVDCGIEVDNHGMCLP